MRVINLFLLLYICVNTFSSCKKIQENKINPEAINAYIKKYVNNRKYDIRLYDPPPPPEMRDSLKHDGRRKSDSIINKLIPLNIYVNHEVKYDSVFNLDKKQKKRFDFVKNVEPTFQSFSLDRAAFSKQPGIALEFISREAFFEKYEKIRYDEGYGGFVSFWNLIYSENKKKAYFVVSFYRSKLNASTAIIYAEKKDDDTWEFKSEPISIS